MASMMVVWYWLVAVFQIEQLEIFYQEGIDFDQILGLSCEVSLSLM